jgi:ribosome-binding protein aMBF1 (putative translation factor)
MVMRPAREQAGLTVQELAQKTNIRPEIIETLEDPDSRKAVSFETIAEIATALGLELRVDIRLEKPRASEERGPWGVTEQSGSCHDYWVWASLDRSGTLRNRRSSIIS